MTELDGRLTALLMNWYRGSARDLPWRQDREPYHVWLSEIMLQQTRVEAVRSYYSRFLSACPNIEALASAQPDVLNKLWEGLGYYSRVRNLQRAAQQIIQAHDGAFPQAYAEVRALPGIGDYTAGAICSICFDQPTPALDGNVLRVVSRLTGCRDCVDLPVTKRAVTQQLAQIYPQHDCGTFTQSLMDLGATVCLPNGAPHCELCPARPLCTAGQNGTWAEYPVRKEKRARRVEQLTVFVLRYGDRLAVRKRGAAGLLAGLWEFPNVSGHLDAAEALQTAQTWGAAPTELTMQTERSHIFTHVRWDMRCYYMECRGVTPELVWANPAQMAQEIALPTAFRMFRPDEGEKHE